jgi:hypothetical protein
MLEPDVPSDGTPAARVTADESGQDSRPISTKRNAASCTFAPGRRPWSEGLPSRFPCRPDRVLAPWPVAVATLARRDVGTAWSLRKGVPVAVGIADANWALGRVWLVAADRPRALGSGREVDEIDDLGNPGASRALAGR